MYFIVQLTMSKCVFKSLKNEKANGIGQNRKFFLLVACDFGIYFTCAIKWPVSLLNKTGPYPFS